MKKCEFCGEPIKKPPRKHSWYNGKPFCNKECVGRYKWKNDEIKMQRLRRSFLNKLMERQKEVDGT